MHARALVTQATGSLIGKCEPVQLRHRSDTGPLHHGGTGSEPVQVALFGTGSRTLGNKTGSQTTHTRYRFTNRLCLFPVVFGL